MGIFVKHVARHPKTGRLSFRRAYPPELLSFIATGRSGKGPTELKISLRTHDERDPQFLIRYSAALAQWDGTVAQARKAAAGAYDALDAPTIAYLGKVFEIEWLKDEERDRWAKGGDDWGARVRAGWDEHLDDFRGWRAGGDVEAIESQWRTHALALLEAQGKLIDPADHEGFLGLCRELNDAAIRVSAVSLARLAGETVAPPPPPAPIDPRPAHALGKVPLLATFDAYAAATGIKPNTAKDWRVPIVHLVNFLGHDDASKLTKANLIAWRDVLLTEVGVRGRTRQPVTVRGKFMGSVKATLSWAVEQCLLPTNVALGVVVRVPKRAKLREQSFTQDEAEAILTASLQKPTTALTKGHALARRWIPWLCAYSGARVNELTQLRAEDVRQVDGCWAMNITPDAGTVKDAKARLVPLHSHLIDQGFLHVVEAQGSGPLFFDPSRRRVEGPTNRYVSKVGERIAEWVREQVGITDPSLQPNHAWRHRFTSMSYALGIEERMLDAILGHAPASVGRGYEGPPLRAKAEAIEKVPRYDVPGA
jgi:integrase